MVQKLVYHSVRQRAVNFLVNVEGRDKGLFSEEDFIVVNCMCEPVFENEEKPAAESFMHADIYKKSCRMYFTSTDCR